MEKCFRTEQNTARYSLFRSEVKRSPSFQMQLGIRIRPAVRPSVGPTLFSNNEIDRFCGQKVHK